jgi:predicted transcriptional regulator YdeE
MEKRKRKLFYFFAIPPPTVILDGFIFKKLPSHKYLVEEYIGTMDRIYEIYRKIY